jgi:hypothetical protein
MFVIYNFSHLASFVDGFIFFADQSWVDLPGSPAVGNVAGHIAEGACLLTGRTLFGHRLGPESITTA